MKLELAQPLLVGPKPFHFIVIGAGGTGGYLIPYLCRMIAAVNDTQHSVTIVDGDIVEEKNCKRQNFILADIGENKAKIMATRYGTAFGVNMMYVDKYLETDEELMAICNSNPGTPVIIGCVDNNKTRQVIHTWFKNQCYNQIWIDSGNEEWFGQVVLGYNSISRIKTGSNEPYPFYCPPVTERYPEIMEDTTAKFNSELSCAERSISAPQSIMANVMAATCIMNIINSMITSDAGLRYTEVMFNAKYGTASTKDNTMEYFEPERYKHIQEVEAELAKTLHMDTPVQEISVG
jgi:PRTRC genetic system ThiF family protein